MKLCSSCKRRPRRSESQRYCNECHAAAERRHRLVQQERLDRLVNAAQSAMDCPTLAEDTRHRLRVALAPFLVLLLLGIALWTKGATGNIARADAWPDDTVAVASKLAVRLDRWQETPTSPPPTTAPATPSLFAPPELDGCAEMTWYRINAGLPARFDQLGWRESNCRNEDAVRTYCCHGYWQLYISLWLTDHRMAPRLAACGVDSAQDVNSDTPGDKWRQGCAAKAAFDVVGYSAWASS